MSKNLKIEELSIVIPIYNEEKNIKKLWIEIRKNISLKKFELIYVDDNSKDNSHEILKKIINKDNQVKVLIRKNKIKDLSKSCILGFSNCKYKNILVMDGDFQHNPKYIPKFIKKFNSSSCDVVVGCRNFFSINNKGLNFFRTLVSIILIFIINFTLGKKTSDPLSGFFMFKKKLFTKSKKKFFKKGYKILADIIFANEKNIKVEDIKINFEERLYGKSKINVKILFFLLIFVIRKILK